MQLFVQDRAASFQMATNIILQTAEAISGCEAVSLRLFEEERWLPFAAAKGFSQQFLKDEGIIERGECICGRVATGTVEPCLPVFTPGGSFVTNDTDELMESCGAILAGSTRGRCIAEGYKTVAVFPLRGDEDIVGVLHVASRSRDRLLPPSIAELESFCARLGGILTGPAFIEEKEKIVMTLLTQTLLPPPPSLGDSLSLGFAHRGATSRLVVGGDFYDMLIISEDEVCMIVGDFCGSGIDAAGLAARTRFTIMNQIQQQSDPVCSLIQSNKSLCGSIPEGKFATAICCVINLKDARARISSAGHPHPIFVRSNGEATFIENDSLPLGLNPDSLYGERELGFKSGDTIIFYTDGLIDTRGEKKTIYGPSRLLNLCKSLCCAAPQTFADELCRESDKFASPEIPPDDKLVLAVRYN